ncbi:M48 family metallopeptidase [Propionicimonas sp. T2.31MG-18]|uniref:M48 family metallopeptidase n=1 Tax=Propionicimonas sp. T2.31MG-18 TaxID=3157620 RepID=UPI00366D30AD
MVYLSFAFAVFWVLLFGALALGRFDIPGWLSSVVMAVIGLPFVMLVTLPFKYWEEIVQSVEVSEHQYPEVWAVYQDLLARMEVPNPPRLYIKNGNGELNAHAAKRGLRKTFIVVYSDVVDTFYELGDHDTLRFIIAHELGHVKLGHINIRRIILRSAVQLLYLSNTFTRAQEYSADRIAAALLVPEVSAARSLSILYAGKRNYQSMDLAQYANLDLHHINGFWVAVVNFLANHPVGRRRLAAANQMDTSGDWNVHGSML